ncbi:sigma-70 family RNA polymerase sigma factor [Phenylobacterium sp.]|uniref:sigma-70 family RNA polymerase sigma factor n=1 Tax=Phenylobacterium sp. TaxID=1871053 RepID=UPI0025E4B214|nr:sigma-70 family RNA polymerase sigma factor [Phenylobacterium sp.]
MTADLELRLRALMRRAQDGDAAAWRELLGELSRRLSVFFARRLGPAHAADIEDLVQETLLAIHRRRVTYDAAQPFTAWAHAVARYKLIDFWRRRRIRVHVPLETFEDSLWAPPDGSAEARLDLERVLGHLPERQQRLIRDVKIEGLSLAEAGARAGMTEGAAKVSLHRAMAALTARMREREDG